MGPGIDNIHLSWWFLLGVSETSGIFLVFCFFEKVFSFCFLGFLAMDYLHLLGF